MSMSRQDFVAVAHALHAHVSAHNESGDLTSRVAVVAIAYELAAMFAGKYPSFDRDRFLAAVAGD